MAQFQKGQSGNPAGRPLTANQAAKIRKAILKESPEIVAAMIDAAKAGDTTAARALLVTVCPPLKAVELPCPIPLPPDGSLADQGRAVVTALARGQIAPTTAAQVLDALASIARLVDLEALERRIEALENPPLESRPPAEIEFVTVPLPE